MRVASVGSIVLAAMLASAQVIAQEAVNLLEGGDAKSGATKAAVCGACHGPSGNSSNPEWPNLAGQGAAYTVEQLHLFKEKVRNNPIMQPIVDPLTDADIRDLATYYATLTPAGLEADPSYWQAGERLYRVGDSSRGIPACAACHGPVGRGNPAAAYPALLAQHSVYTVKQLNDYAQGTRYPGAQEGKPATVNAPIMTTIAQRLTPEEIRDVASYIQGMR